MTYNNCAIVQAREHCGSNFHVRLQKEDTEGFALLTPRSQTFWGR